MKIDPEELISQAQAARIRGCSHQAIVGLVKRGKLRTFKIGDKIFVLKSEVEAYNPGRAGRPKKKRVSGKTARKTKTT
jgi:hypothetical protein